MVLVDFDTLDVILFFSGLLEISIFIAYIVFQIYVIRLLTLKSFNKSSKISMAIFTSSIAFRFLNGVTYLLLRFAYFHACNQDLLQILAYFSFMNILATILSWIVLYYFVFEIQDVRDRLQWSSKTVSEFKESQRKRRLIRFIAILCVLMFTGTIAVLQVKNEIIGSQYSHADAIIDFIVRIPKFIMDLIVGYTFLSLLDFFKKMKMRTLQRQKKKFTRFNRLVFIWIMVIFYLKVIHALCNLVFNRFVVIMMPDGNPKYVFEILRLLYANYFIPIVDFLTASTLLYLYYFQGKRVARYKDLTSRARNLSECSDCSMSDDNSRYNYSTKSIERLLKSKIPVANQRFVSNGISSDEHKIPNVLSNGEIVWSEQESPSEESSDEEKQSINEFKISHGSSSKDGDISSTGAKGTIRSGKQGSSNQDKKSSKKSQRVLYQAPKFRDELSAQNQRRPTKIKRQIAPAQDSKFETTSLIKQFLICQALDEAEQLASHQSSVPSINNNKATLIEDELPQ
ncbi:hypothetical protein FGO68_gene13526 [Halteria grandinella]|uniref:Uncharacterized protein n=1 Tax=Halteria grandinella TaxID=5974 RepID=A0A8J8NQA9_HALGN|nr:hypothetical protein FGO68_gene13526 [Halteria grandinella]